MEILYITADHSPYLHYAILNTELATSTVKYLRSRLFWPYLHVQQNVTQFLQSNLEHRYSAELVANDPVNDAASCCVRTMHNDVKQFCITKHVANGVVCGCVLRRERGGVYNACFFFKKNLVDRSQNIKQKVLRAFYFEKGE